MNDIRITTYNTHLFLGTVAVIAAAYEDELRKEKLIWQLLKVKTDVVTLNEVWADSVKDEIIAGLRNKFPHAYYPPIKETEFKLGSGLLILSKYKIVNPKFTMFTDLVGADAWSQKGFIQAELIHDAEIAMRIITTHTQSGITSEEATARASNFSQINAAIRATNTSDNKPLLVTGDLNVVGEQKMGAPTQEYKSMTAGFAVEGLVDAYRTVNPNAKLFHGFSYNGFKNKLIPIFAPEDYNVQQRLDYVFINQAAASIDIGKTELSTSYLYSDPKRNELMDISDHYPLNCAFATP